MTMTQAEHIALRVAELEVAITTSHPQLPHYLKLIHAELLKAPELVHIMTNEQRSVLLSGLQKQTGISLFAALKPKKVSAKAMAGATLEDFGL